MLPLLLAAATLLTPHDPPRSYDGRLGQLDVDVPRIEAEATIDGRLDEEAWGRAARLTGFSQYAPYDDRAAGDSTEVLVWYSAKAIHFGFRAHAPTGSVRASLGDRDKSYTDDYVGVFLATLGNRRQAVVFASNPLGVQGDGIVVEGASSSNGGFGGAPVGREPTDISPDFVFQSKGRLTEYGYEVEIRVPFKSIQFENGATQRWGFNALRKVQSSGEEFSWAPARRSATSYITQFGHLENLTELDRGLVLDVTPIVTARAEGARAIGTGTAWSYDANRPRIGGNVRWGMTSNLTLNGTVRPDFAEVESDAGQLVTDPRLTLFFPEKRPFFLDGAEQFTTPGGLIYTRRIASPEAATKVAGTLGGASVAALAAVDAKSTSLDGRGHPLFTWLRLQRTVGRESRFGMVYTGRDDGQYGNHVAGADARLVFSKSISVQALAAVSHTADPTRTRSGPLFQLLGVRTGRRVNARYSFKSIGSDFYTASGYLSRDSIANINVDHGVTFYGPAGALVQSASVDLVLDGTWRSIDFARGGDALEKKAHFNTNYTLRGGWRAGASVLVESFGFDPDLYRRLAVERHTGARVDTVPFVGTPRLPNLDYVLSVTSPNFRHVSFNSLFIWGRDENFYEWSSADIGYLSAGLTYRPTPQLRINQTYGMQSYRRRSDGSMVGISRIPRLKVEYQLTRAALVRAVAEYDADRVDALRDDSRTNDPLLARNARGIYVLRGPQRSNVLRPDFLFAYTPVPGTVLFAGYGSTLTEDDAFRFRRLERTNDGFFVKASYLIRG
jgi:hypothetical protein